MRHILTITDKDITGAETLSTAEPRIAVNAVLFDADKCIALSYMGKYDLHTLPGGGIDPGEDLIAAVKRETLEETGCRCEIIGELGQIFENRSEHDFTQERYYIEVGFGTFETLQSDITQNDEMFRKYTSGENIMILAADGNKLIGVIGACNVGQIRLLFVTYWNSLGNYDKHEKAHRPAVWIYENGKCAFEEGELLCESYS